MTYSFSITTRKGDEYRIKLLDVDISVLAQKVRDSVLEKQVNGRPKIKIRYEE